MRGDQGDALDVVVFRTLGAPQRRPRRRPRRAPAGTEEPEPTSITRVTSVAADGFADESDAKRWLDGACKQEQRREDEVEAALQSVNRAIHAQRLATSDPYVCEVSRAKAREVRLGYGSGDEVVEGNWRAAAVLPRPRRRHRRRQMIAPQHELSGILSGRSRAYASEDLALRARLDLDQARSLQAALQLQAALEALAAELRAEGLDAENSQLVSLRERTSVVRALVAQGLREELDEEARASLLEVLEETERLLRRRRHTQETDGRADGR